MTRHLGLKLLRDLRRHWPQFLAVLLMSLLSVLIYTGLEGAWNGLRTRLDQYASGTSLADVWVQTTGSSASDIEELAATGHLAAEGARTVQATDLAGGFLEVEVLDGASGSLSTAASTAGAEISASGDGIWLGEPYARALRYQVGDQIDLRVGGSAVTLAVLGTYFSPEKLYYTGSPSLVAPEPALYGYAAAPTRSLFVSDRDLPSNLIRMRTSDVADAERTAIEVLGDDVVRVTNRSSNLAVSTAFDRVDQIRNLSVLFSSIFVLLATLAMYTSTRRLVDMQVKEIATLKALGMSRRTIGVHFALYGLLAGGVGGVAGLVIAPVMSTYVLGTQKAMISMPSWGIAYTPVPLLMLALVVAVCTGGAYLAARPALRRVPAEQLRPGVARGRRIALERIGPLWRRLSYGSRWAWRDSGTNPVRLLMGVVAVAGSIMLLFAGFGMADSMQGQVVSAFEDESTYGARVSLAPGSDPAGLAAEVGEQAQQIVETIVRTDPGDGFDRVLTVLGAGDFVHLSRADGSAADRELVSVTEATARRLGLDVGDSIAVVLPAGGGALALPVEQVVAGSAPQGIYLSRDRWERLGQEFHASTILVGGSADIEALRASPLVTSVITRDQQRDNAEEMVRGLEGIFVLIRVFAILLTVIVLYSLGSLAFTERVRDYATLKVLGLSTGALRRLAARENIGATVIGVVAGVPAGHLFLSAYVATFSTARLEYTPQISAVSVALACSLAVVFSLATTFLLGRRVRGIDCASALKGVE
ncbi:FtsX-like permease family protein [Cellulomonas hominis]